jgi:hypothetical protein
MMPITADALVRNRQIEEREAPVVERLWDEIRRLKREKNAFLPAHNYQVPEIQAVADYIGDSFELAVRAKNLDVSFVVFCGVRFMAEGCYTLSPTTPSHRRRRSTSPASRPSARWPRSTRTRWPSARSSCEGSAATSSP